jgi:hypothetical protein
MAARLSARWIFKKLFNECLQRYSLPTQVVERWEAVLTFSEANLICIDLSPSFSILRAHKEQIYN